MLGLIGFLKKKLDFEGKLPDKWKDGEAPIPSANPITYNEETHILTLKAGQYLKDYKGRNRYVLQDINLDCALGLIVIILEPMVFGYLLALNGLAVMVFAWIKFYRKIMMAKPIMSWAEKQLVHLK